MIIQERKSLVDWMGFFGKERLIDNQPLIDWKQYYFSKSGYIGIRKLVCFNSGWAVLEKLDWLID